MSTTVTYKKQEKQFSPESIESGTGYKVNTSVQNPDEIVIIEYTEDIPPEKLEPSDAYMANYDYVRIIPAP